MHVHFLRGEQMRSSFCFESVGRTSRSLFVSEMQASGPTALISFALCRATMAYVHHQTTVDNCNYILLNKSIGSKVSHMNFFLLTTGDQIS
jgi:hypothetical protein